MILIIMILEIFISLTIIKTQFSPEKNVNVSLEFLSITEIDILDNVQWVPQRPYQL